MPQKYSVLICQVNWAENKHLYIDLFMKTYIFEQMFLFLWYENIPEFLHTSKRILSLQLIWQINSGPENKHLSIIHLDAYFLFLSFKKKSWIKHKTARKLSEYKTFDIALMQNLMNTDLKGMEALILKWFWKMYTFRFYKSIFIFF